MAGELRHASVGRALNRQEWEGTGTHELQGGQTGDLIVATSATVLGRLAVGVAGQRLRVVAGVPTWS